MSDLEFDFVVVGAGIVGSWTAKELKKHGRVLLLEQFREPHTRGSSHGQSRLIRSGYPEPFFAELIPHAIKMWRQAEQETNEKLLVTTGVLCLADSKDSKELIDASENMKRLCPDQLVELNMKDVKSKYPSLLNFKDDEGVFLDKTGGVLLAHKAVRTIQKSFEDAGGIFWDACKVSEIIPKDNKVTVVTCKGEVVAKSVVLCAGTWTKTLLNDLAPSLPLQPKMVKVYYWKEKEVGAYSAASGFPALLTFNSTEVYLVPGIEYKGLVKVCIHGGVPCNPEERDKTPWSKELDEQLRGFVKEHLPLLESEPSIIETCMYTCTPDSIFVIDTLPKHKNIVVGTGFSGTGFKTSPIVGRLLSELARGVDPLLDLSPYSISRFSKSD